MARLGGLVPRPFLILATVGIVLGVLGVRTSPVSARSDGTLMAAAAAANGRSVADMAQILADPTARLGVDNRVYYSEPRSPASVTDAPGGSEGAAPFPLAQTFQLHSRPGSQRVIYLDFDGATVAGTAWNNNAVLRTPASFDAEPFSIDAAPTFSDAENDIIQSVWQRVSEDYAIFDVDVTTQDPGQSAITRSDPSDQVFGTRALITNTRMIYDACDCGGRAYLGVFDLAGSHARFQPAFIFNQSTRPSVKFLAEVASHEVGHNLDLEHDGLNLPLPKEYYEGHGAWAPIMGTPYAKPISQWSKGEYAGANNLEDDLAIINTRGAPLLVDDHGDTLPTSTLLRGGIAITGSGTVNSDADVDVFRVAAGAGTATFTAVPAPTGPNLDIQLELRSADGVVIAASNPPSAFVSSDNASGLSATVTATLPISGSYYLLVSGVGAGSLITGYSGYASIGRYTLTGSASVSGLVAPTFGAFTPSTSGITGVAYGSYTFMASGSPAPSFSVASGVLPAGLALDPTSGVLSGTPIAVGSFTFTVRAANGVSPDPVTAAFTVVVSAVPVFTAASPPTSGVAGAVYGPYAFAASGSPPPTFALASGVLPAGIGLNASTGALSGTLTTAGGSTFTVRATNGISPDAVTQSFTITVAPALVPTGSGNGYWLVASDGGIFAYGDAGFYGSTGGVPLVKPIVGMTSTKSGKGYRLAASDGGIFAFGDATFFGSTGSVPLAKPIVGMASTPSGLGYWLVASDGGIFAFGDAAFVGSTGGTTLTRPIVGMTPTSSGKGYWLVASDGGIFAFGDATFFGSAGGTPLAKPIVGMARTPSGIGYWLVASDGGIFAYGDAVFRGSTGNTLLAKPIVGMASTPTGNGYWITASDGGIFAYGDAVFRGSAGGTPLSKPIVGMVITRIL